MFSLRFDDRKPERRRRASVSGDAVDEELVKGRFEDVQLNGNGTRRFDTCSLSITMRQKTKRVQSSDSHFAWKMSMFLVLDKCRQRKRSEILC